MSERVDTLYRKITLVKNEKNVSLSMRTLGRFNDKLGNCFEAMSNMTIRNDFFAKLLEADPSLKSLDNSENWEMTSIKLFPETNPCHFNGKTWEYNMHSAQEFYLFFAAIPEENWHRRDYINQSKPECRCASGHLRRFHLENGYWRISDVNVPANVRRLDQMLTEFLGKEGQILHVNDGSHPCFPSMMGAKESVKTVLWAIAEGYTSAQVEHRQSNSYGVVLNNGQELFSLPNFDVEKIEEAEKIATNWNLLFMKNFKELYKKDKKQD